MSPHEPKQPTHSGAGQSKSKSKYESKYCLVAGGERGSRSDRWCQATAGLTGLKVRYASPSRPAAGDMAWQRCFTLARTGRRPPRDGR